MSNVAMPRRPLCLILLAAQLLTACMTWRTETVPLPQRLAQSDAPSHIRVWLRSGKHSDFDAPTITADTLHGFYNVANPISVPVADVTRYATHHLAVGRTLEIALTVLIVVVVVRAIRDALNRVQWGQWGYS